MRVTARLHGFPERERAVEVPAGASVADVLRALGVAPGLVLVFRGRDPVPETDDAVDGETLRVVRVVSGGSGRDGRPRRLF